MAFTQIFLLLLTCLVCSCQLLSSSATMRLDVRQRGQSQGNTAFGAVLLQVLLHTPAISQPKCVFSCNPRAPLHSHLESNRMVSMSSDATIREKRLLRGVLVEAIAAQERKKFALEQQVSVGASILNDESDSKALAKAKRRAEQIPLRLAETDARAHRLLELKANLSQPKPDLVALRGIIESEMGLATRLENFDLDVIGMQQWGRPTGFDGLVIESKCGIPILVGRTKGFSDALLRRVARGNDLWFQVRAGVGARVLLRTSIVNHLKKSPRECQEMAADLAAYFSSSRRYDEVEVMFTDSRHVAKRGGRVGQMKASKRLGSVRAQPHRVKFVAREAQEEQGWL